MAGSTASGASGSDQRAVELLEATGAVQIDAAGETGVHEHPLARAAVQLGLTTSTGTIAFIGQYSSGQYQVQYNRSDNHGFSSAWPQWAYEIAKTALVSGKRVWVGANGDPFGSNLVFVHIFAT